MLDIWQLKQEKDGSLSSEMWVHGLRMYTIHFEYLIAVIGV